MKKAFFCIYLCLIFSFLYSQDGGTGDNINSLNNADGDTPDIQLPEVDVTIDDKKEFELDITGGEDNLPDIDTGPVLKPEFGEQIKVDLEETLPEKIDNPDKTKPIDAVALFGYGLNNSLWIDFSIFVKDINPKLSLHYTRQARETHWIENTKDKTPSSFDHLTFNLFYNYKALTLYSDLGYFAKIYNLQDQSIYETFTKRIINADFSPVLKLNNQNDLSLNLLNDFVITTLEDDGENDYSKIDFHYLLASDFIYTQVFGSNHFFSSNMGYDFNIFTSNTENTEDIFYTRNIFNTIKAGAGYSVLLADAFFLKAAFNFNGFFHNRDFFWYLLPYGKAAYNYKEYFTCYVEGGADLIKKPKRSWYYNNEFTVLPEEAVPGYHWFAKSGVKGALIGWLSGNADIEFAYNGRGEDSRYGGFEWTLLSDQEKIYTLEKRAYFELNLEAGFTLTVKNVLEMSAGWKHRFLDLLYFQPRDEINARITVTIPRTGFSIFADFQGQLLRRSMDGYLGNVYLLNAGADWNFKERLGLGCKFTNILYFQHHQFMQYYDEPGFSFIAYFKIGF